MAFVPTPTDGRTLIWLRSLDSTSAQPLENTDGATYPFWSPDGRRIAFFADGQLKIVEESGGGPHAVCNAPDARGGTWGRDNVIVFSPQIVSPLYRVSSGGGEPVAITTLDAKRQETSHRLPSFLPDGRHFLFLVQGRTADSSNVMVGTLDSAETHRLTIVGSKAVYSAGYLLFARDQSLAAQPFDVSKLQLSGEAIALGDRVMSRTTVYGDALFSVTDNGSLTYWNGGPSATALTWIDRNGTTLGTLGAAASYNAVVLSPDERTVAAEIAEPDGRMNLWLIDAITGIRSRFTSGPGLNWGPLWSPDGTRVVFGTLRNGPSNLYQKELISNAQEEPLLATSDFVGPTDWSPDGNALLFQNISKNKIGVLPLTGTRTPTMITRSDFVEGDGRLSPDGRWLAYTSNESGTWDIYVKAFSSVDRKWRVSPAGGSRPRWRRDGQELFYVAADQILTAVSVSGGPTFAGTTKPLFGVHLMPFPPVYPRQQYAVNARGDQFLVNSLIEPSTPSPITVVLNWPAALRK